MDRREIFLLWTVPPAVLGGTGLVVAWWFNRMRRSRESSAAKTRWGILVGFSLAISILSGMFLVGVIAVDRFQPGWLY